MSRNLNIGGVSAPSSEARTLHKPVFIGFLLVYALAVVQLVLKLEPNGFWGWVDGLLLMTAAATTLVGLGRRLPTQNVFMVAVMVCGVGGLIQLISAYTHVPFGPLIYTDALGAKAFNLLPFTLPLLWVVVIVNSRGVARLIMRPWRKTTYYGFWVIGLTVVLALVFDLGLEPFATRVKRYWAWDVVPGPLTWHGAPWVNFLGWAVSVLGIMGFSTPWLINKQPVKQPTDYHPMIVWLLWLGLFALGCALDGRWSAVGVIVVCATVAISYAIRGARW